MKTLLQNKILLWIVGIVAVIGIVAVPVVISGANQTKNAETAARYTFLDLEHGNKSEAESRFNKSGVVVYKVTKDIPASSSTDGIPYVIGDYVVQYGGSLDDFELSDPSADIRFLRSDSVKQPYNDKKSVIYSRGLYYGSEVEPYITKIAEFENGKLVHSY